MVGWLFAFYFTEIIEITIQFAGNTIFLNKLSVIRKIHLIEEIMLHSLAVMLLAWFIWQTWNYDKFGIIWAIGGYELC